MTEGIGGVGYDAAFLPQVVRQPGPGLWESDLVEIDGRRELAYTHFSLAMSASRRLARWVAWNIDGAQLPPEDKAPSRAGLEFRPDPRIPESMQVTDEVYADNSWTAATWRAATTWSGVPPTRRTGRTSTRSTSPTSPHSGTLSTSPAGTACGGAGERPNRGGAARLEACVSVRRPDPWCQRPGLSRGAGPSRVLEDAGVSRGRCPAGAVVSADAVLDGCGVGVTVGRVPQPRAAAC